MGDQAEPNDRLTAARQRKGWSRAELAEHVVAWLADHGHPGAAMDQRQVGRLERGQVAYPNARYRRALRAVLEAQSDASLGFLPRSTSGEASTGPVGMDDVDRRSLLRGTAALGGMAAAAPASAMSMLLDAIGTSPAPARVGIAEVDQVRAARQLYDRLEFSRGGGIAVDGGVAQLRAAAQLLDASCPPRLRPQLLSAVGELADTVAFSAFDAGRWSDASRIYQLAEACAAEADDLTLWAHVVAHQAFLAMEADRPADAVELVDRILEEPSGRLTDTELAYGWSTRARALGGAGDVQGTLAAIGRADELVAGADPVHDPAAIAWYPAEHPGAAGHALYRLTLATGTHADEAIARHVEAIETLPVDHGRALASVRLKLATIVLQDDPDEGAAIGLEAVEAATTIRSVRTASYLRRLHEVAGEHRDRPAVAEMRSRTADALLA